jgi:hypothetical protein
MPFWFGVWWVVGVGAVGATIWLIDRRSARATVATAAPLDRAAKRTAPWPLPITTAGAALVGGVLYAMVQSVAWNTAFYPFYIYIVAALFAAPVALGAGLHERSFRFAAWVLATVGAGFLIGELADGQVNESLVSLVSRSTIAGRAMYWVAHLGLYSLCILAPAALLFRALPSPWVLAGPIGVGLILGVSTLRTYLHWAIEDTVIPWIVYGACVGSLLMRRKTVI